MSGYAHDEASQPKYHIERLANSTVAHVVMKAAVAKTHGIAQVEVCNGVSGTAQRRQDAAGTTYHLLGEGCDSSPRGRCPTCTTC
jgi:hypothetical protein